MMPFTYHGPLRVFLRYGLLLVAGIVHFTLLAGSLAAQDTPLEKPKAKKDVAPFEKQTHIYSGGPYKNEAFDYLVLKPKNVEPGKKYPLVLFLHGAGERGTDISTARVHFPDKMATKEYREKFPCFLIVPQCRPGKRWVEVNWSDMDSTGMENKPGHQMQVAIEILDKSIEQFPVDRGRIYLTGLSMGGYGSWELAIRHPERFAAVVPICGGGDEKNAARLVNVPIWAVHGDKDNAVPVERSRRMIEAIKKAGGTPKYTEYAGVGHNSWTPAYADPQGVLPWMFSQVKKTGDSAKKKIP